MRVHTRWDRPIKVDQKKEPYLMLNMRAEEPLVRANYNRAASQKSGTNTAIFSHRIRPGDTSPNGVVIGENGSGLRGASRHNRPLRESRVWRVVSKHHSGVESEPGTGI